MKIRIYLFLIFLLTISLSYSQCPTDSITLSSQAEVNAFPTNFPGCTVLDEILTISGPDIVDLSPLAGLTQLNRSLVILNNPILPNLNGLHNIETIAFNQNLVLDNNPMLIDMTGLTALQSVDQIIIRNCDNLVNMLGANNIQELRNLIVEDCPMFESFTDLSAVSSMLNGILLTNLPSLTSLSDFSGTNVTIIVAVNNCDLLLDAQGLDGLSGTRFVEFRNNDGLQSLDGLTGLNEDTWTVEVSNNPNLTSVEGLSNLSNLSNFIRFQFNNSLETLAGLENLTNNSVNSNFELLIQDNLILSDITALANIDELKLAEVTISGNPSLSQCAIESVCDYLALTGVAVEINNNATGCNTVPEVQNACSQLGMNDIALQELIILTFSISNGLMYLHSPETIRILQINIFATNGKMVHSTTQNEIDLTRLSMGIYFARIETSSGFVTKKFLKK